MISNIINKKWELLLENEFKKSYFNNIIKYLNNQYSFGKTIFPDKKNIFRCLNINPQDIKVIIVGQDPYHNENQANGLAFSVNNGEKIPPSLKNIYKEIELEYNQKMPDHGDLSGWEKQGVLLLNTSLTVEKNMPASHSKIGWSIFTNEIIKSISDNYNNNVFLLWGNHAKAKEELINKDKNLILTSAHPSPFSATKFFGNNHFLKTNEYLLKNNKKIINWYDI